MKPLALTLANFGSFVEEQTFHFPRAPGLYFMWGDNQAEPRLEGNGAGKSTLWKALTWLFYGKTAAGLKAGDVANWGVGKKTLVRLKYEMWGIELSVERTWAPNSWVLIASNGHRTDLVKDPTNTCLEELALEFEAFVQTVVMPQRSDLFLDLKSGPQAELFSAVMGLDRWLKRSTRASDLARDIDVECRRIEKNLAHVEGQLSSARTVNVEKQLAEFEASRRDRLAALDSDHAKYTKMLDGKRDVLRVARADVSATKQHYAAALAKEEEEVKLDDVCSKCGQPLRKHAGPSNNLRQYLRAVDDAEAYLRNSIRDLEQVELTLDRIEDEAEKLEGQPNPYTKLRDEAADTVRRYQEEADQARKAADDAQMRFSIASAWVKWFKEIRLAQIGEALTQLEIEANNEGTALGLVDWELRFDVDRETKGGSVQRGFSVSVLSPHNSKPVPWEAWSGGEAQRLIVAAQMGLADVIRSRTGAKVNLEVWDEPTTGMSPQGVDDLLQALHTRAMREQRQIWVVDHRTLGFNRFAGTCGVVKTSKGSRFDFSGMPV